MTGRKLLVGILGLVLITGVGVTILFFGSSDVLAKRPFFYGETETFRYTGKVLDNGDIEVTVYVDIDDAEAVRAYKRVNDLRGRALIARATSEPIWVQVTFSHPVPLAEVHSLVEETGFQVATFLVAGRNSKGGRGWCIDAIGDLTKPVCDTTSAGVMVLQGWVKATESGLGRLLDDKRIYMADTTAVEIQELLAQRHRNVVSGKRVVVTLQSPFSRLEW